MNVKVLNDQTGGGRGAARVFRGARDIDDTSATGGGLFPVHTKYRGVSGCHGNNACKGNICSNHSRVAVMWCNNRGFG